MSDLTNSSLNNRWPWPPERWQRRLAGIVKIITETRNLAQRLLEDSQDAKLPPEYQGYISNKIQKEKNHIQTCINLLNELEQFVPMMFGELKERFAEETIRTGQPIAYTENFAMSTLIDKLSVDINIIQQAIQQRQINEALNEKLISHQGYILQVADALANRAMKPAVEKKLIEPHITPLTHLQNKVDIRLIPYEDVILLSVPYGAMNSTCNWLAMDYLAIPHEIGHFLYWWGVVDQPNLSGQDEETAVQSSSKIQLHNTLKHLLPDSIKNTKWIMQWLEEMFADTYGCIIAGPVNVLSFQELLANGPMPDADDHKHHDHKHPFPALRPLIQTQILRLVSEVNPQVAYTNIAKELDKNWIAWSGDAQNWQINPLTQNYQVVEEGEGAMTGAKIIEELIPVLRAMISILKGIVPENASFSWSGVISEQTTLAELYNNFSLGTFLGSPGDEDLPGELDLENLDRTTPMPVARRLREKQIMRASGEINKWLEAQFAGWSTEGPDGGNTGL